jgi:hypothetical protein
MKKIVSVVIVSVLAAIAPVLTLALLHAVGGTAQAQAPPATFWKVSMPDLGQHSDNWCWVGAAADSFWWYGEHGQEGLLGGLGLPWEAIDDASKDAGSACWYDSRDVGDGAAILGYARVLKKIAESTFKDFNQDGIRQPGAVPPENNYCYGEGVEKWDYLIGLRDYVNLYGSALKVHDIIDPAKCGVHTGLIVNRNAPTTNSRDPCSNGHGVPGVPGVDQVVRLPTFLDYQTELSGGQDVLLWMEPAPSYYPETAHVVTGVGYDTTPGVGTVGTVTVSDPWTHETNPPLPPVASLSHTDGLAAGPPWQSIPDHNTSPNHGDHALGATEPYNLCDVTQGAPLKIRCYDEDTGNAHVWQVVDMIFVSPLPPATETPTPTLPPTATPTRTPTPMPTPTPRPGVGGVQEMPDAAGGAAATSTGSSGSSLPYAAIAGAGMAVVLAVGAGGWYARRRWLT